MKIPILTLSIFTILNAFTLPSSYYYTHNTKNDDNIIQQHRHNSIMTSSSSSSSSSRFITTSYNNNNKQSFKLYSSYTNNDIDKNTPSSSSSPSSYDDECDVLILGSGPAARAIATLLSSSTSSSSNNNSNNNLDILLADINYDRKWSPNYGVWEDEWTSIKTKYKHEFNRNLNNNCIDRKWDVTDCYFGGSYDIPVESRFRINRPYYRIDKHSLQSSLSPPPNDDDNDNSNENWYRVIKANHISEAMNINLYKPNGSLVHDEKGSTITMQMKDKSLRTIRSKLIVDCTGHETKLVLKESGRGDKKTSLPPGFQIAYGVLVSVDETNVSDVTHIGPYDKEAMTLFDYRTDHYYEKTEGNGDGSGGDNLIKVESAPTFMYAMPLKNNRIFFEETSLVARPAVSFQECKDRCFQRLDHLGIKVVDIEEEEFCYIPMGGPLPAKDQRVIAFGGAAAMVHPSTGYNLCRNMMGACEVAKVIKEGLSSSTNNVNLDKVSASAYHAMWSPSNIRQRNFAVFGGEFLMKQNVKGLRGFFDGFFRLPLEMWGGFLAGWPGLPNNSNHESWNARLLFGLTFVSKLPPSVAIDMLLSIVTYSISQGLPLPQSVTPFFGEPESYEYVERPKNQGDVAAKNEARKMIEASKVEEQVPVAFEKEEVAV